jgi:hypothetical protein
MARLIVFGVALAGVLAVFASSGPAKTVKAIGCGLPGWPQSVFGVPSVLGSSSSRGYFLWQDQGRWHLRARVASQALSGRISASAVLRVTDRSVAASDRVSVKGRSVRFRFSGGGTKGFDFRVGCSRFLSFALGTVSEGKVVGAPEESPPVYLGARGRAPGNVFRLSRSFAAGIEGWLTAGPACPVEVEPGNCSPTPVRGTIRIDRVPVAGGGRTQVAVIVQTDARGFFHAALAPGRYRLRVVKTELGVQAPPARRVEVRRGVVARVTLVVDTGIR